MDVYFILVEPQTPENVGSSARAMKTMGFSQMRLVNPCNHLDANAKKLAYGSEDILKKAVVFPSLSEAISDLDLVIATTVKRRTVKFDFYKSDELLNIIERKGKSISSIGIVFGREDHGLGNEEISLCHLVSYIPLQQQYPSLNLSQAVMLYAYCLSPLIFKKVSLTTLHQDETELKSLKSKITKILQNIDLGPDKLIFNRIMERVSILGEDDIHILHTITAKMNEK
jgi:tRNA/rRNA methyltransferase